MLFPRRNLIIATALAILLGFSLWNQLVINNQSPSDLTIYLKATVKGLDQTNPYQPFDIGSSFVYPPPALLLLAPLARLGHPELPWGVATVLSMVLVVWLTLTLTNKRIIITLLLVSVSSALIFPPFIEHIAIGQINSFVLLGIVLFMFSYRNSKYQLLGSFGLAFAILIKISPLVFLVVPIAQRKWRRCLEVVLFLLSLSLIAYVVFGFQAWAGFFEIIPDLFKPYPGTINMAVGPSLEWIFQRLGQDTLPLFQTGKLISVFLLVLWLVCVIYFRDTINTVTLFSLGLVIMTLASQLIWYHHLILLTVPALYILISADLTLRIDRMIVALTFLGTLLIAADRWLEQILTVIPLPSIAGYSMILLASFGTLLSPTFRDAPNGIESNDIATDPPSQLYRVDIPRPKRRLQDLAAAAILLTFTAIAVWYAIAIPLGEAVDEVPHFEYVLYLKENKILPVQPDALEQGVDVWMGHHPPLYYLFGATVLAPLDTFGFKTAFPPNTHFVWRENDGSNGWNVIQHYGQDTFPGQGAVLGLQTLRLANIVLSLVGLSALLVAGRMLFGSSSWLPIGIVGVIAFNPSFIFMTTTVHHDVMQSAVFAMGILWLVYLFRRKDIAPVYYILGGVVVAAAMLTKLSGASLALTFVLSIVLKSYPSLSWRRLFMPFFYTFGTVFLLAGWWYIRNWVLYGDPLGWNMFLTIHQHMVRQGSYTVEVFFTEFLSQVSRTFWGAFGYMHITFPGLARGFGIVGSIALLGFIVALLRGRLRLRQKWKPWLLLTTLLLLLFASFIRFSIATVGAGHARYLFPALFVIGVIMVVGLNELTSWLFTRSLSLFIAAGLAIYSIWLPITHVLPKYAAPETIKLAELPFQAHQINETLKNGLILTAYEVEEKGERLQPGQLLPVTLYWRVMEEAAVVGDDKFELSLQKMNDTLVSYQDWPVPSLAPAYWQDDKLYVSRAVIEAPSEGFQDHVQLIIRSVDPKDDTQPDRGVRLTEFIVRDDTIPLTMEIPHHAASVIFDHQLALQGVDLPAEDAIPGTILPVELFWEVLQPPKEEYTTFIHLLDEAGTLVAQCDRPLGGKTWKTTEWASGQRYSQLCPVELPADLVKGNYNLSVGLYSWPSLERVPVSTGAAGDLDSHIISNIQIDTPD